MFDDILSIWCIFILLHCIYCRYKIFK